jgi:hypothetical protein
MNDRSRAFPFRWVFPIGQLFICAVALWPIRGVLVYQIRDAFRFYDLKSSPDRVARPKAGFHIELRPEDLEQLRAEESNERRQALAAALNVPAGLLQLPYAILNPGRIPWVPRGIFVETWRAMSWPLIGIMFWWAAGRGLEGLLAARQGIIRPAISWVETGVAAVVVLIFGGVATFLPFDRETMRGDPSLKILLTGCGLWAILACVMIAARIAQWRLRVASKSGGLAVA